MGLRGNEDEERIEGTRRFEAVFFCSVVGTSRDLSSRLKIELCF